MTKISIIVPVYNSEKYLERCFDSILNQTFKDYEVILINDGSTDKSLAIIKKYAKKDKRVVVIDQENIGVSETRNKGINMAKGEYLCFVDNDDYLENNYLEMLLNNNNNNNNKYDIIISGYRREDCNKRILNKYIPKDSLWSKYVFITPWGRLYRKEFIVKNKIKFLSTKIGEDIYFNLQAYKYNPKIKYINYIGYIWFYNNESVSNTVQKGFNKKIEIEKFLDMIYFKNMNKFDKYFLYRYGVWYLLFSGRNAKKEDFVKEYAKFRKWNMNHKVYMNINPFSPKLKGETIINRLSVLFFNIIEKLHLVKLFAIIYCKGRKNES